MGIEIKQKSGFTLSEVLITLAIIGVVAALTIPNLTVSVQNHESVIKLKKFFGTMNNGFSLIMLNKGCEDIICTGILNSDFNVTMTNIQNINTFNIIKKCNRNQTGCHDKQVRYLNNNVAWIPSDYYSLFVTSDGMVWGIFSEGTMATDCSYEYGTETLANGCFPYAFVDVNGEKLPNKFGRDIFRFYILKDGSVVPTGMYNDTYAYPWTESGSPGYCYTPSGQGEGCAARIIEEGWDIKY